MAPRRPQSRNQDQMDLLSWQMPEIVDRFLDERITARTWRDRVARAVSDLLKAHEASRDEIAQRMSDWLEEDISRATLDNYASQAKEAYAIKYHEVIALGYITGDRRLLQLGAEPAGWAVIDDRYVGAVEAEILRDQIEELETQKRHAQRRWKGGRP